MPVATTAAGADQPDADPRASRRMAGDIRQTARQARERAQAMLVDNNARRTRMRKMWANMEGSAPPVG
jgi:hypothetical protein